MKIAFSGGPHSGKSAVLMLLEKRLVSEKKNRVVFVPEAASEILSKGKLHPLANPYEFQREVLKKQLESEDRVGTEECLHRVFDRAIPDAYTYLPRDQAGRLLQETMGESANLPSVLKRYDACLFFDTYYAGHISSGNKQRVETSFEDLMDLSQKTLNVWKHHPRLLVVPSAFATIEEKTDYVAKIMNQLLREKMFV